MAEKMTTVTTDTETMSTSTPIADALDMISDTCTTDDLILLSTIIVRTRDRRRISRAGAILYAKTMNTEVLETFMTLPMTRKVVQSLQGYLDAIVHDSSCTTDELMLISLVIMWTEDVRCLNRATVVLIKKMTNTENLKTFMALPNTPTVLKRISD